MWAIVTNGILGLYWVSILFNRSTFQLCGVYLVYLCYFIWLSGGLKPMGWIWIGVLFWGNDMRPATCTIWMLIVNMVLLEHCCWCINNESLLCQTEYEVRFKWHCLVLDLSYQLEFCFFSFWCFCHFVFLPKKSKKKGKRMSLLTSLPWRSMHYSLKSLGQIFNWSICFEWLICTNDIRNAICMILMLIDYVILLDHWR